MTNLLSSSKQTAPETNSPTTPIPSAEPPAISSSPVVSLFSSPTPTPASMPSQTPLNSESPAHTDLPIPTPSPTSSGFSHDDLVNYALVLINSDRQSNGVANVSLSNVNSAQNHADEMLQNNYTCYWDTNGYKPHMRYTLAGGLGAVSENIASTYTSGGTIYPFDAIKNLETLIMNSPQKTNIVYPFHNKVNIGIAFDNNVLYFVEDFENVYVT